MSDASADASTRALALLERRFAREREARRQAEALLEQRSRELFDLVQRLQMALEASGERIWEWRAEGDALRVDPPRIDGGDAGDPIALDLVALAARVHPEDRDRADLAWRMHLHGHHPTFEATYRLLPTAPGPGPAFRWVRVVGRAVERDPEGLATRIIGTLNDITEARANEEALGQLGAALAGSREPLVLVDDDGRGLEANPAFLALAGLARGQLAGWRLEDSLQLPAPRDALLAEAGHWSGEVQVQAADGRWIPVELLLRRVQPGGGAPHYDIASLVDLSERRDALRRAANTDLLTGLANRHALQEVLEDLLSRACTDGLALLFIDLDGFRHVNGSLGHAAGDLLLREVARRFRACLGHGELLARWAADQFVVLQRGGASPPSEVLAQALLDALAQPMELQGHLLSLRATVGVARAAGEAPGADGDAPHEQLLAAAEQAARVAKDDARTRIHEASPDQRHDALGRLAMLQQLQADAEAGALSFVAQPKVDADGGVRGYELLMRWSPPRFGPVSPAVFIPLAEAHGLITRLGEIALLAAVAFAARLRDEGVAVPVAVNLSAVQVLDPGLEDGLLAACASAGLEHGLLELEVTESAFLADLDAARGRLERLHARGFRLALDDFGTGFSSLSYLRHLPFDSVKLDRSFIAGLDGDPRAEALVAGIVALCRGLGLSLVAEGVETVPQHQRLRALGVEAYQGYLFHRPLALDAAAGLPRLPPD